jgi:hypothetical protein
MLEPKINIEWSKDLTFKDAMTIMLEINNKYKWAISSIDVEFR